MKYKKEVTVSFLFNSIVLLSLSLFFLGCATVQIPVVEVQHSYVLSVVDLDDNPLEGATIEYTITDDMEKVSEEKAVKRDSFITTVDGLLTEIYTQWQNQMFLGNTTLGLS